MKIVFILQNYRIYFNKITNLLLIIINYPCTYYIQVQELNKENTSDENSNAVHDIPIFTEEFLNFNKGWFYFILFIYMYIFIYSFLYSQRN